MMMSRRGRIVRGRRLIASVSVEHRNTPGGLVTIKTGVKGRGRRGHGTWGSSLI